ncbi:hypothetical protein IMZ11_10020 [Microtetraspora sp. AC03309]|uniref:hypothetical protein n=1 Tax=Microtetraspora sp. AC03309 TaxID=2779376 RepID=UPI001E378235|nr:hypothetical protein [Microtetraspora sp. AC03309]MCC5575974.1 hypothetical protein [Microtetraspora sp. AC03309]
MTESGAEPAAGLRFLRGVSAAHESRQEPRQDARQADRDAVEYVPGPDTLPGIRQEPRPVPQAPRGGEEAVQGALSALRRLGDLPVAAHVGVFEEALTCLESALASVDEPAGEPRR